MEGTILNIKQSLLISLIEIVSYLFLFFVVEFIYLHKGFGIAINSTLTSVVVRIIYIQIFVQIASVFLTLFFSKNVIVLFIVMIFSFVGYYAILRGGWPPLRQLFGFGMFHNTTPSFLMFFVSSLIGVVGYNFFESMGSK